MVDCSCQEYTECWSGWRIYPIFINGKGKFGFGVIYIIYRVYILYRKCIQNAPLYKKSTTIQKILSFFRRFFMNNYLLKTCAKQSKKYFFLFLGFLYTHTYNKKNQQQKQ